MAIDNESLNGMSANQSWTRRTRSSGGSVGASAEGASGSVRASRAYAYSMDHSASTEGNKRLPFGELPVGNTPVVFSSSRPTSSRSTSSHPVSSQPTLSNPANPGVNNTAGVRAIAIESDDSLLGRLRSIPGFSDVIASANEAAGGFFADHVTPLRLASHFSVLVVAAIILMISQIELPTWDVNLRLLPEGVETVAGLDSGRSRVANYSVAPVVNSLRGQASLQRSAIPFTIAEEAATKDIQYYTVQPGDTVLGIADKFDISPETIIWSNSGLEQHVELIQAGDKLAILPVNGAYHTVETGDSLSKIAERYSVSMQDIISYEPNGLEDISAPLTIGQKLVVPGGSRPFVDQYATAYTGPVPTSARIGSGNFVWPASGGISQTYWGAHRALDISGWTGADVKAADSGYVTLAATGWNTGYGSYVIIDHGNGFSTLYAHLNSIYVRAGESVSRGQAIAGLGNTGNSTGPHLHFEIRYQGVPHNPMGYMP